MGRRDVRVYLHDVLRAAEAIESFTRGKSFEDYLGDPLLRSAVERQFEIVGEALAQACRLEPELVDDLPEARSIIGFRNQVIHGYADVDDAIVWGSLRRIAGLKTDVERVLVRRG